MVDAEQCGQLDLDIDLFAALTDGSSGGILVVVDESSGKAPFAISRFDRPTAEDDAPIRLDDDRRGDLGVAPQHVAVGGTDFELAAFHDPQPEWRAAVDAEVPHDRQIRPVRLPPLLRVL